MKARKMIGLKVISLDAQNLGEIAGVQVDTSAWKVTDLELKLDKEAIKEMGLKKPKLGSITVCLPVTYIKQFGDVITVKHTQKALSNLKECKE
jgi:sporulation protein YlmC with PRC-barrel domain